VDFSTTVLDDRNEFASRDTFPDADRLIKIDDYSRAFDDITTDADSFIVIVTHGHMGDLEVLRKAVTVNSAYIGMIGSRKKTAKLYETMRAEGCSEETLARIYTPVGEPIFAETPAEIAVSIAAEMIKVRSGHGTR
jgi:xanthine dehydrogenase accessory factor